jgi:hypothetical protein
MKTKQLDLAKSVFKFESSDKTSLDYLELCYAFYQAVRKPYALSMEEFAEALDYAVHRRD